MYDLSPSLVETYTWPAKFRTTARGEITNGGSALSGQGPGRLFGGIDMKTIWILAAAATLAACGGRGEDDMGAAPERDTTAATTGADTGIVADTAVADTALAPTTPGDTALAPADTGLAPTTPTDTTMAPADTGMAPTTPTDTTSYETPVTPDTTGAGVDTSGGYAPPPEAVDTTSQVPGVDTTTPQ
jgi:hypothetical protein